MPISKELYAERKQEGLCTRCGEPAESNRTLCSTHLKKANQTQKAVIARRKARGLCFKCGQKLTNNRKTCNDCLDKNIQMDRPDVYIPVEKRREMGLCFLCGKPSTKYNCRACYQKYRKSIQDDRFNRGICIICGKRLAFKNKKRCIICLDKTKRWYSSSGFRLRSIERAKILRMQVIEYYGGKCACCGETEYTFLAIDHINGGGTEHRKKIKKQSGTAMAKWLIDNNFPDGFQILCHNCNMSKHLNQGICAHKMNNNL